VTVSISHLVLVCINSILSIGAASVFVICVFFLLECSAALLPKSSSTNTTNKGSWQDVKVAILIPAHNEELVINSTLEKLIPVLKNQDCLVVVADNCNDATAEIARTAGATVVERHNLDLRGKGYALDYGLQFLESNPPDVVAIVDADCIVYPGAIEQLTQCTIATGRPVQATYLMVKHKTSVSSKDSISQFSNIVRNLVRPHGLARLGLPSPLLGTGMAFPWSVIRSVSLEDLKLGLDLTIAGHKPVFCPEATVLGYLPKQLQAAKGQRTRWEHGHLQIMQAYIPALLKEAFYQRRLDLLVNILDLCIPPLSLLVTLWSSLMVTCALSAALGASWIPVAIAATAGFCFLSAILIAWVRFARKDIPLQELLTVPFYILWKIPIYIKFLVKPQKVWVRTERDVV
jgi:cellulose synthase/poly-beta-1,6-N-acetylglucosamine synthase-like glycosyltransferase